MSTKDLLNEYNELARLAGKPELKVWKASKAKLEERLEMLENECSDNGLLGLKTDDDEDADVVTLADLARELGRNPKVVRAKLRRRYSDDASSLPTPIGERWTFHRNDRDAVLQLIG